MTPPGFDALYDELRQARDAAIEQKNVALMSNLALMTAVTQSVPDAILVVDGDGNVVAYNRHFQEMWGFAHAFDAGQRNLDAQMLEHALRLLARPDVYRERVAEIYASGDIIANDEVEFLDGRAVTRYSAPVRTPDGVIRGRVWCFRDVTEERKLSAHRAVVGERMASVGQLVASVAHEINNPLAFIGGNLEIVLDAVGNGATLDDAELRECLEDARTGVERIKVIVRDLRMLSRVDSESRDATDVRAVLETALQMANNELRHRARIVRALDPVPLVSANAGRLGQVFLNLLVNAAHAIPDGRASHNTVTVRTGTTPSGGARIELHDTGCGIAPEHIERIFDPFFTTKPIGAGTGLGLSICKGIIDKLGGTVTVESKLGEGTTFVVMLPAAAAVMAPASPVSRRAASPQTAALARVLVVDDDAQIRRWLQRVLDDHDVVVVPSVDAAEEILERESFDVILCDVMMPDRTGLDMHRMVETRHPAMLPRIVFMSGGAFTPALSGFLEHLPTPYLRKPFRHDELVRAIAAARAPAATQGTRPGTPSTRPSAAPPTRPHASP